MQDNQLTELEQQALNVIRNHKKVYSVGLAQILNVRSFTALRCVSRLIKEGYIVKQKGVTVDGERHERARLYKLKKEAMWMQPALFDKQTA